MTIPGRGDLSPRRKRRNWRRRFAVVGVIAVVGGLGYGGFRLFGGSASSSTRVLPPCPAVSPTPSAVRRERVVVRNATLKTGLAAEVARDLRKRGFRIGKVGNTLFRGKGVATVKYSADRLQAARVLAAQFSGATVEQVAGPPALEVDIGPKFDALVPLAQAQAAERGIIGTPRPAATVTVRPTCAA